MLKLLIKNGFLFFGLTTALFITIVSSFDKDEDCLCPMTKRIKVRYCGHEMLEMNRRAKVKVKQTSCSEHEGYYCRRGADSAYKVFVCPPGTRCMKGNEQLAKLYDNSGMLDPILRFCINETGI